MTCVDDSRLVSSILERVPDLVIVDVHTAAIRQASSWGALGIKPAPAALRPFAPVAHVCPSTMRH